MKFLAAALTLLTSTLGVSAYQSCKSEKEDLIQTGAVEFNNDGSGKQHCYTVGIDFKIPKSGVQTAVSTDNLNGYRPATGLDFSIRASQKDRENAISLSFLSADKSWKKVSTSYLATSRPDIQAGSFIADAYSCSEATGNFAHHFIQNGPTEAFEAATFISGLKTQEKKQDVELSGASYDHKKGELSVKIVSGANQGLQNVHISYVIWNPKSELTLLRFDPLSSIIGDYELLGAHKYDASIPNRGGLGILSNRLFCTGSGCKTPDCLTLEQCKKLGGINIPNTRDCLLCGPYEKIQNSQCVPDCKANQIFEKGICVCKPGYIKLLDKCVWSCGINQIWRDGCICDKGFTKLGGICKKCPELSTLIGDKCVCQAGYEWIEDKLQCEVLCGPYEKKQNGKCVPNCRSNEVFDKGICVCKPGYAKLLDQCVWSCGVNEIWKNGKCVCDDGFAKLAGVCRTCPDYSTNIGGQCVCKVGYQWNEKKLTCDLVCGINEVNVNNACICLAGHVKRDGKCTPCPQYAHEKDGQCHCDTDYLWDEVNFKCYPAQPTCPPRSKWNQKKLSCECTGVNEFLIDGLCRKCSSNEGWNGEECVCISDYFKINGACRTCDPNTYYNGRDCICNHGFYGNADRCDKCHESCGQCSGPKANQCITCSDVSYDLKGGECIRNTPCPTGLFLDGDSCKPCSSYCGVCSSENVCDTCIDGFKLEKLSFLGQTASYCTEICGDGKRFELECDDGNQRNDDGCNNYCEVEKDYHCQGGSSIKASTCVKFLPDRSYISTTGTVHLFGRVVQGIRLSYIPPELTANECALCSKLLWVRVIDSKVVPGVRINYLPKSKYQFLAEFEFNGLFAIPVFAVSIQINPDFAKYFKAADLAQIEVKKIDPSVLKKFDKQQALGIEDVFGNPDKINISDEALAVVTDGN